MLKPIARFLLWLGRWKPIGGLPEVPKAVVIAYPHTSNWDGIWALIYKVYIGLDVRFFGKQSLFWFPLGVILRALGGIPLDRGAPGSAVEQAVREFERRDTFYFGLAPEGTRSLKPYWKSGFYRIATEANVPIVLGYLDYGRRQIGLGESMVLTGDPAKDLERIRAMYEGVDGRWPEKASPIEFPPPAST
jgi:1-acyl-sn-glycerol-3-phosphate acyltransferase